MGPQINIIGSFFPSWMLCAAIDIGSNTTRLLVAEPVDGQLKTMMEQRAYTRIVYPSRALLVTLVLWVALFRT